MFEESDIYTVITSTVLGACMAVFAMIFLNRRNQRTRNQAKQRPWNTVAKLYHTPSFLSSRCTWLVEGRSSEETGARGRGVYFTSLERARTYNLCNLIAKISD